MILTFSHGITNPSIQLDPHGSTCIYCGSCRQIGQANWIALTSPHSPTTAGMKKYLSKHVCNNKEHPPVASQFKQGLSWANPDNFTTKDLIQYQLAEAFKISPIRLDRLAEAFKISPIRLDAMIQLVKGDTSQLISDIRSLFAAAFAYNENSDRLKETAPFKEQAYTSDLALWCTSIVPKLEDLRSRMLAFDYHTWVNDTQEFV